MCKKLISVLLLWCGLFQTAGAQEMLQLKGICKDKNVDVAALKFYVKSVGDTTALVALKATASAFEGEVAKSASGFYQFYGNNQGAQLVVPLYLPDAKTARKLQLRMKDGCVMVETGKDNQALSAYNALTYVKGRMIWEQGRNMDVPALKAFLKGYESAADSIIHRYGCSVPVAEYLHLWAYVTAYNDYLLLPNVLDKAPDWEPFPLSDILEQAEKVLDGPKASYFQAAPSIVYSTLPKADFDGRLAYLYGHYTDAALRDKVAGMLVDDYVRRFKYDTDDFDAGLAVLESAVEKYGLDRAYADRFRSRKSSIKGKAFPEGLVLEDADGNRMDFGSFKGYYVYVDLWASWCVPCCREVPYLQKLEQELENKDVKFLSISLDRDEKAWKERMASLNMHGNQWRNPDDKLAEALNVKGIPRFLIYDKNGCLYYGNAPRPSHPELKNLLEGLH